METEIVVFAPWLPVGLLVAQKPEDVEAMKQQAVVEKKLFVDLTPGTLEKIHELVKEEQQIYLKHELLGATFGLSPAGDKSDFISNVISAMLTHSTHPETHTRGGPDLVNYASLHIEVKKSEKDSFIVHADVQIPEGIRNGNLAALLLMHLNYRDEAAAGKARLDVHVLLTTENPEFGSAIIEWKDAEHTKKYPISTISVVKQLYEPKDTRTPMPSVRVLLHDISKESQ